MTFREATGKEMRKIRGRKELLEIASELMKVLNDKGISPDEAKA